jgi:hypothetical protein
MKKLSLMNLPLLLIMASLCTIVSAAAPVYINNVGLMPDWQQPNAPLPFGNLPGYPNWCSPTAVANAFGWWEDAKSAVGLTDRLLFNATTAAPPAGSPLAPGQWNERLWQDGTIELGWYMDTGPWQTSNPQFPGNQGTLSGAIGLGGVNYATGAWVDGAVTKVAFPNASVSTYSFGCAGWSALDTWNDYKSGIDSGLPVVVSWETWVKPNTERLLEGDIYTYDWAVVGAFGHTTTGIGYIDPNSNILGDEWIIVHDDWSTTQKKVAMPLWLNPELNTYWRQDDLFLIPEPATIMLLGLGGLLLRRKR